MELEDYGIDRETLERMYSEWREKKVPKTVVEQRYLGTRRHHGKLFSKLVEQHLGISTEQEHPMHARIRELESEVDRLRAILRENGIDAGGPGHE